MNVMTEPETEAYLSELEKVIEDPRSVERPHTLLLHLRIVVGLLKKLREGVREEWALRDIRPDD